MGTKGPEDAIASLGTESPSKLTLPATPKVREREIQDILELPPLSDPSLNLEANDPLLLAQRGRRKRGPSRHDASPGRDQLSIVYRPARCSGKVTISYKGEQFFIFFLVWVGARYVNSGDPQIHWLA